MLKLILTLLITTTSHALKRPDAFCEPSKSHIFPEMKTRRKIEVNEHTGDQKFYEQTDASAGEFFVSFILTVKFVKFSLTHISFSSFSLSIRWTLARTTDNIN